MSEPFDQLQEPGRDGYPAGEDKRKQKLGEKIARQILNDIIDRGWKAGEVLGTERELLSRYGISRATFREAVRQVERHGAAMMRRGAGGGLVIRSPAPGAAVRAMLTFLELTRVSFAEQHEVREQLELEAARLASKRIDEASYRDLVAAVKPLRGDLSTMSVAENVAANMFVRVTIASATQNPSLPLFIETLNGVMRDILKILRVDETTFIIDRDRSVRFKLELVDAILSGDTGEAERLVREDVRRRLLAMTSGMTNPSKRRDMIDYYDTMPSFWEDEKNTLKLSERSAFALVDEIERQGWQDGLNLGNEAALQKKLGISRAVLREAIRQLELHGIARVKSGVNGGLIIGTPDSSYTEDVVSSYLRSTGIAPLHLWETQSTLEIFAAERLAATATVADFDILENRLENLRQAAPERFLEVASELHAAIADGTRNRALALFIRVLLRYGSQVFPKVAGRNVAWLLRAHEKVVAAISTRDGIAARQEMTTIFTHSRLWIGLPPES